MAENSRAKDAYRELFERSADAILIIEGETFIDCNQATVEMLRYSEKSELLKTHPSELSPPTQPDGRDSYEKANEMIAIAFERGSHRFEWMHKRADGEVFPVEVLLTAVQEPDREVLHVVWRDITERKALEAQLRNAQKMEAVGNLAGGIAHDFNNLLVAILGHSDFLAMRLRHSPDLLEHVKQISHAGDRAASLVRQLLTFAHKQPEMTEVLDLDQVIDARRLLLERLLGENIEFSSIPSDVALRVRANRGQLEQILLNLASNARDAMPRGGALSMRTKHITVDAADIGRLKTLQPGSYAVLSVSDTGVGMDAATAARAFDPFFTTKERGQGTGLGLAIVYGIVKQAGGSVTIHSAPGHGTTLKIYLPLTAEQVAPSGEVPAEGFAGGNETVLVVEDDEAVSTVIVEALESAGYQVLFAADGRAALDVYREHHKRIELVLTDVIMPHLSGPDLIAELNRLGYAVNTLFMSGYTDDALSHYASRNNKLDLLEKPFSPNELLRRVRQALDRPGRAPVWRLG